MLKRLINFIMYPYTRYKDNQRIKKRLAEMRERDPFIYK